MGAGEGEFARSACVPTVCADGEGEREIMPEAMLGLPIERRTVSSVRSILRSERVRISCFLDEKGVKKGGGKKRKRRIL